MLNYRSFAQVLLVGKLGQDAKVHQTKAGSSMLTFSVATNSSVKQKDGTYTTVTTWHECLAFGNRSEKMVASLKKGTTVCVQGSLNYREVELKNGYKGKTCSIFVEDVQILADAVNRSANAAPAPARQTAQATPEYEDDPWMGEDEIPC